MKNYIEFFLPTEYALVYRLLIVPNIITNIQNTCIFQSFQYRINKIFYKEQKDWIIQDRYDDMSTYNHDCHIKFASSLNDSRDLKNQNIYSIIQKMQIKLYDYISIIPKNIMFVGGYEFDIIDAQVTYV